MERVSTFEGQHVHARFMDAADEPMHQLAPIKGYQNMPLVSLEEAVKPIAHFFDSIDEYVWAAKQNCIHPQNNLTQDESASIHLYTMEFSSGPSFYRILNGTLRSKQRRDIKVWFLYLKLFFVALHKLPSETMQVWRGVSGQDLRPTHERGKEVFWLGVSSCTETSSVLEDKFLGQYGLNTLFCINCFNAKSIRAHSYYPEENELILMPGSCFQVKDVSRLAPNLYMIELQQIKPKFPMVESPFPKMTDHKYISQTESNSTHGPVYVHRIVLYDAKSNTDPTANIQLASTPNVQPAFTPNVQPTFIPNVQPTFIPEVQSLSAQNLQTVPTSHIQQVAVQNSTIEPKVIVQPSYNVSNDRDSTKERTSVMKVTIVLIFLTFFPVATLIFGQLYKNDCPVQPRIPQWTWIFGAVGFGGFGFLACMGCMFVTCCFKRRNVGYCFGGFIVCLLSVFFLGWLITGSIWLFPVHSKVNFGGNKTSNYCNEILYKFTFGTLLAMYSLVGIALLCGVCLICIGMH